MMLKKLFIAAGSVWLLISHNPVFASDKELPAVTERAEQDGLAQDIMLQALDLIGVRYRYGGKSPETGLDCSGFIRYVFQQSLNISLPHNAFAISKMGDEVQKEELKPGDLVFFNTLKRKFSHVGIYLGDNRFVHAPSSGGRIRIDVMGDRYWNQRFNGARRVTHDSVIANSHVLRELVVPAKTAGKQVKGKHKEIKASAKKKGAKSAAKAKTTPKKAKKR